jgi:hypothetical protein
MKQLKLLFKPEVKAYESVGGFISIGNIFPASWDWASILESYSFPINHAWNLECSANTCSGWRACTLPVLYEIVTGRNLLINSLSTHR